MKQKNNYSEQFLRKRKMMLVAPVVFLPMLCLAFYGLGGGRGDAGRPAAGEMKGLNMTLPLARFDARSQPQDKLGFYEKAKQDSMRLQERKKMDPYVMGKAGMAIRVDSQADQALAKLEQLKQVLGRKAADFGQGSGFLPVNPSPMRALDTGEVTGIGTAPAARITALLDQMKGAPASKGDPQMDRLDGMLDKLIRIQHPEMVQGDTARAPGSVLAAKVGTVRIDVPVATLSSAGGESEGNNENGGGFMEIGVRDDGDSARELAIEAVVNHDQTMTAGSTVELRILHGVMVNGREIPANELAHGVASLSGERLMVNISSIGEGASAVPVSMQAYDMDGLVGIRVPGSITRDVSKESADQALAGVQMASLDPSLSAQAASAGLEFARSLASRKIRTVWVSLPAGHLVLLKNIKSNTH
jgi:hypothetical protein